MNCLCRMQHCSPWLRTHRPAAKLTMEVGPVLSVVRVCLSLLPWCVRSMLADCGSLGVSSRLCWTLQGPLSLSASAQQGTAAAVAVAVAVAVPLLLLRVPPPSMGAGSGWQL